MIVNIYVHVVYATMIKCIHTNTITYFASIRLNIVKTLKLMYHDIVSYRDYTILRYRHRYLRVSHITKKYYAHA